MAEVAAKVYDATIDREIIEEAIDRGKSAIISEAGAIVGSLSWPMVRAGIADSIAQLLSEDKLPWLAKAWGAARTLRAYKDTEKYPAGTTSVLNLGEHDIDGALNPVVEISSEGVPLCQLQFEVPVTASMNAVNVSIRDGHLVGAGGGECELNFLIRFAGVDLCDSIKLADFNLPGKLDFKEPIPIP